MVFGRGQAGYLAPPPTWTRPSRSLTLRDDRQGLYRYDPEFDDLRSLGRKGPYSFWASVKYTLILSIMLWWIPTFGQMIAGYVGGRKAGNHWKGAAAAFFPVAVIWTLFLLVLTTNEFPQLLNLALLPAVAAYGLGEAIPLLDPYLRFLVDYLTAFVIALRETAFMGLNGYLVTIIFAYIGGLIADQLARERAGGPSRQVPEPLPPPGYEVGYLRVAPPAPRHRLMASAPPWYGVHGERYDHLRRIPVAPYPYEYEEEEYYEPPPPPVPAQRRIVDPYPPAYEEERPPRREPPREPPRRGRRQLDREELIRRLVERALRDYDHALH